ncbi:uncharacterized protein LOC108107296 isoform X2 [Drosophila eugracilis]|nr:uncharacterized protein LOC108107296 isoform X2 [Drosophila eugracilis]
MPVTVILPDMFDELAHCLRHGVLPFYWDPELNMLEVLTTDQVLEMYLCVQKIPTALRGGRYGDRQKCYSRIDILRVFSHKNRKKSRVNKPKWNGIERMKSIPNVCT